MKSFLVLVIVLVLCVGCATTPNPQPVRGDGDPLIYRPAKPAHYPTPYFTP